jgi:cell division protein FtsI/penicillin-binding protein 2
VNVTARPELRWRIIGSVFAVLLGVVVLRLVTLQVVEHAAAVQTVRDNSLRISTLPAARGDIRDRTGTILVGNQVTQELRVSRQEATLHPEIKGALAALTGVPLASIESALKNVQYDPYQPVPILVDTPPAIIQYLHLHPDLFPGVTLTAISTRTYPNGGNVAPHAIGYVGAISSTELASHTGDGYRSRTPSSARVASNSSTNASCADVTAARACASTPPATPSARWLSASRWWRLGCSQHRRQSPTSRDGLLGPVDRAGAPQRRYP